MQAIASRIRIAPVRAPTPTSAAAERLFLSLQTLGTASPLSYVARNFRLDRAKKMIAGKFRVMVAMQVLGDY
jgi:hypothetical protein